MLQIPSPVTGEQAGFLRADDFHGIRGGIQHFDGSLKGHQGPGQHADALGQCNAVFMADREQVLDHGRQVNVLQAVFAIDAHVFLDALGQVRIIRRAFHHSQSQDRIRQLEGIPYRQGLDGLFHQASVPVGQGAHHAEVDVDDLAVAHPDVSGMGIGVEKAEIRDLCYIVGSQAHGDFVPVVAFGIETCIIVDFTAGDVLHDHDFPAREILIDHGGRKPGTVFVVPPEPDGVLCFVGEVHLLLGAGPEFIQDHVHVHDRGEDIREFQDPGGLAQKADVLLHFLVDTRPLHFHDHHRPVLEPGFVDLGNGGRSQGRFVYACEHLVQIRSIGFRQDLLHGFKGHGFDIRPEFFQFAAVAL